jgi:hypothetical protein
MNLLEIPSLRALNQNIVASEFTTPNEVVQWMGAMQAQDFPMAEWAIGLRMQDPFLDKIRKAFNTGEIIRTHVMRPTWHFVSSKDVYWMLDLTASRILSSMKSRHKAMGLSQAVFSKCNKLFEKALASKSSLTRDELVKMLNNAGIKTNDNRLSHILFMAELDKLICSGPMSGNKQTYALLSERVPKNKVLPRDEALAELAKRYFTSRGPATVQDFAWWSGLSLTESRQALDSVKPLLVSQTIGQQAYWLTNSSKNVRFDKPFVRLLPAYDEFLISYKDRSASLSVLPKSKIVSENGFFRPVIIVNGRVTGLWMRKIEKNKVMIKASLFQPLDKLTMKLFEKEAEKFAHFSGNKTEITASYVSPGTMPRPS